MMGQSNFSGEALSFRGRTHGRRQSSRPPRKHSCYGDLGHGALLSLIGIAAAVLPAFCQAQTSPEYVIRTIAGNGIDGFSGDGGAATAAQLMPQGVAVDSAGNLYIADTQNNRIRKVSNGVITTVAGNGTRGFSGDNGPATSAQLNWPQGVAMDSAGNLYIADSYNSRIRKVSGGVITTFSGIGGAYTGNPSNGDNGPASSAQLRFPVGVAVDSAGNLYIADELDRRVRKVSNGVITTVAGNGTPGFSGDNGPAAGAQLNWPCGVAVDSAGSLYIAEGYVNEGDNIRIRKVSNGMITTVAGNGTFGFSGDNGLATFAQLSGADGIAVDGAGNFYISACEDSRIRKVSNGWITTMAGNGTNGFTGDNGLAVSAELSCPTGIAADSSGNVYIADTANKRIRVIAPPCTYSVSPTTLQAPAEGGSMAVSIQTTASCSWAVSSLPSWITVSGASSGTGPASISLGVAANSAAARTATISFAGISVQVTQPSGIPVPSISAGGVVNAASYGAAVAPGGLATVFGKFLLNSTTTASGSPWPTALSGLSLQFAGQYLAPLYAVSTGQATVQVPWEVVGQTRSTTVTVTTSGQTSPPQTAFVEAFAPAIFTLNQQGTGQGAILDSNTARLVDSSSPAVAGSTYVAIYCTGLGKVTNRPASGAAALSNPLSSTTTTPVVTIGGVPAAVLFSGLAPGAVGLYQVNVQVPAGSGAGNSVPVVISIGGATSNSVTMAVKAASSTGTLQIQVTGLPAGTGANVTVTGPNGFNTTVTANASLQVAVGNYSITANTVLAGGMAYGAFPVQQTATVGGGSSSTVQVSYTAVMPLTTTVLDHQGTQNLAISPDGTTLTLPASSQTAQSLSPGSVLAIGSTPAAPNGLLRKVVSVSQSGSQVNVQTTQATLVDAFQQANFASSIALTPQNTSKLTPALRGVTMHWISRKEIASRSISAPSCNSDSSLLVEMFNTPIMQDGNGSITVSGEIDVCPSLEFDWNLSAFPPRLNSLLATTTLGEAVHVNITGTYHSSFKKEVDVATVTSEPVTVFVGPVPIVLTPTVTFFIGVSGEANAGFSIGATQTASVTGGFSYANGHLTNVSNSTSDFSEDPVGLDANLSAKAYAGLAIDLNIDGVLSPDFSPDAYLQLDVNLFNNPWWKLSAGLEGSASLKVGIFGVTLADFDSGNLFDFSKVIAQASGGSTGSNVAPVLSFVSPSSAPAGSQGLTLTLTGLNFVPGAAVSFNGASLAVSYLSPTQLIASLPASALTTAGTFQLAVTNPDQTGATSQPFTFVVQPSTPSNPVPSISNLSPSSTSAGSGPLTVAINGTGFLTTSSVTFNGVVHAATFAAANQTTISLSSADVNTAGTFQVVVTNPPPGGGSSPPAIFTVQPVSPAATLQNLTLSPASVVGGGSVTGTITLSAAAPTGGVQVQVSSNNPVAQVPTLVNVSGGQSSATFTITTTLVTSSQSVVISASLAGVTKTVNLAVNAATATATVIYAGADTGIYRSDDGAVTWQQSLALKLLQGFVSQILVDPAHHSNVYAGATDFDGTTYNAVVYRSSDAGQTWAKATVVPNSIVGPSYLAVDAVAANILYLEAGGGIYRSTDAGATWQPTPLATMFSITADPVVTGVVYATDGFHIYQSSDFGTTWNLLATFFNLTTTQILSYDQFPSVSSITVDPQNSRTLYAPSSDGWCLTVVTLSQCGGMFKSTDGGKTWQDLGVTGSYSNMTIDSRTGTFYAGGALQPFFGYVIKSVDGWKTWTPINTGLTTASVEVFTDPGNSSNLFAFGQSSSGQTPYGLFRSTNGGGNWTFMQIVPVGGQLLSIGIPAK